MPKQSTPRDARTTNGLCALQRDNIDLGDFSFMVSEHDVSLTAQRAGQAPTARVTVPRAVFDAVVDFYNHGTMPRHRPRSRRGTPAGSE